MPDREKVIKAWEAVLSRDPLDAPWDLIDETLALLKEQEAELQKGRYYSDVFDIGYKAGKESIVMCKDCQFMYISECDPNKEIWCCARHHILTVVQPDFFCADGVRRE